MDVELDVHACQCGASDPLEIDIHAMSYNPRNLQGSVYVVICRACGHGVPFVTQSPRDITAVNREALAAWNHRHSGGDGEAWRSIESAPKDGTRMLVAIEGVDRAVLAFWNGAAFLTIDGTDWTGRNITHCRPLPPVPSEDAA